SCDRPHESRRSAQHCKRGVVMDDLRLRWIIAERLCPTVTGSGPSTVRCFSRSRTEQVNPAGVRHGGKPMAFDRVRWIDELEQLQSGMGPLPQGEGQGARHRRSVVAWRAFSTLEGGEDLVTFPSPEAIRRVQAGC